MNELMKLEDRVIQLLYEYDTLRLPYLIAQLELGLRWLHDRAQESKVKPWQRDPSGRWADPRTVSLPPCINPDCPICRYIDSVT